MATIIGPIATGDALAFLLEWKRQDDIKRADPSFKDVCLYCNFEHTQSNPRNGWDCAYCECC